jgi:16S rRNA (uracil1498-N3)-methyltransferase
MHRFFLPVFGDEGTAAPLPQDEARHLTRVLRLTEGDEVLVFDGCGRQHAATVETITKPAVIVRIGRAVAAARENRVAVTLVQSLLKGDKFDEVVRDAVMLGVASIRPLATSRTEVIGVKPGDVARQDRWQKIALASAKQCGRAVVPDVSAVTSLADVLNGLTSEAVVLMLAEPSLAGANAPRALGARSVPTNAVVIVGPEGGWSDAERSIAVRAGATLVTLGHRTLRAEAAPIVALTVFSQIWGEFD